MLHITATAVADISIEEAWGKLSDLELAHFYVPDLTSTEITTDLKQGVGASRRVYSNRPTIIETVIEWNEGQGFLLNLQHDKGDGVPPLFSKGNFRYTLTKESDSSTRLTNTLSIEMKWSLFGKLLSKLIIPTLDKMQNQIVVGQKLFYETSEKANRQQVIEILKQKAP